ncbi:TPA: hypothetical protein ACH3X1_006357 [Trebouxia sp. C0004]
MSSEDLVLDRKVRDWVVVPLTLCILLMMLLRQYVSKILASPSASKQPVDTKELREKQALARSQLMRNNAGYIPAFAVQQRRNFFSAKEVGVFQKKSEAKGVQEQLMTNPDMMQNMMKQQLTGLVPQIAMGAFVNYFFSGFIMGKIPFPLSPSFRLMLQRGIDLPSLDVAYFTSLSYYMLLLFGLRGVMSLMFKEDTIDETQLQKQQMTMGMGQMGQDPQKTFEQERAALDAIEYVSKLDGINELAAETLQKGLNKPPRIR